jgi:predicted ATPase
MLQRWRGPAYPELEDADATRAETAALDELRVRAVEGIAEARLAAGDTDGLVADLVELVDREPLRERPRSLLMSALATTGRTAEALRVYDDFRRLLGEELGIAPSPALDAQHAGLLGAEVAAVHPAGARSLPAPITPLVGRERLLGDVLRLADAARVVTLVGPGGVGKTRLLVEAGHRLQAARGDRSVVLSELAQTDEDAVVDWVASALGVDPRPGESSIARLVEVLGAGELVLLIDNCEHVLDAVAELVARLIAGCPNVTVLATSRERLRVPGEHVCTVSTLLGSDGDGDAAAVELFVQRARAVRPDFHPDDEDCARVAEIVRRLDGLPLAIELAAARLHTHELSEIADGLDRPLALLAAGYRTTPRHSSLEAVVASSYELLDVRLQDAFTAVSVFSGPFTLTDAAAVCDLDPHPAADALAQLVERSLLTRAPGGRFAVLETLRAFGADRLAAGGRAEVVGGRHAERMVTWAEDAERRLHRPGEPVLAEIDERVVELRPALGWLLEHGRTDQAGRIVAALVNSALLRLRPDVLAWAERVIAADPDDGHPMASHVWAAAAYAAWMAGDVAEAGARSTRSIAVAERSPAGLSQVAATMRGNVDLFEGRLDDAARWYERAVEVSEDAAQRLIARGAELLALGYAADPRVVALADAAIRAVGDVETGPAAYIWYCAGEALMPFDVGLAQVRLARAVELAERTKASFVRGVAGASKASIEAGSGEPEAAAAAYRWLIPHWQRAGMWSTQWTMLRSIVGVLERLGRHQEAAVLEGAVRSTASGHRIFGADELALGAIGARLREALGSEAYDTARRDGAALDGHAAVELALAAL